jgi:hypothetical protein
MTWRISGTYWSPCSCKVGCPCTLGELEADNGWCSGVLAFDITSGQADGVNLSGAKVALAADWPGGFLAGGGTGRVYFDPSLSQPQRAALERIATGKAGGALEAMAALIPTFLAPREAPINIQHKNGDTRISVGDFGVLVTKPLRGPSGEMTKLLHGAAAFRDEIVLANGKGTQWRDPEMRQWESGGHGEQSDFDWSG